jgi:nitroreductase
MAGILDHIFKRRSIRRYHEKPVEEEKLDQLLQAGMAAPSASNVRPWEFVVITNEKAINRLRENLQYGKYYAPVAIVVCANPNLDTIKKPDSFDFWVQDCSAATQNILLAAAGLGLGACWLGIYPREKNIKLVREVAGLPETIIPLNVIYVGYPAVEKESRTQYDPTRIHQERYSGI